jgi:UDP-N-acetylmuramyl pentapeptide synthase
VERFGAGGQWFPDTEALTRELLRSLCSGGRGATEAGTASGDPGAGSVRILVKGSRVNRLERVVAALVHPAGDNSDGH